jgi:hypothetical protein
MEGKEALICVRDCLARLKPRRALGIGRPREARGNRKMTNLLI